MIPLVNKTNTDGPSIDYPFGTIRFLFHFKPSLFAFGIPMVGEQLLDGEFPALSGDYDLFIVIGDDLDSFPVAYILLYLLLERFGQPDRIEGYILSSQATDSRIKLWKKSIHDFIERTALLDKLLKRIESCVRCHENQARGEPVINGFETVDLLGDAVCQKQLILPCPFEGKLQSLGSDG